MEGDTRHDYGVHAFKEIADTREYLKILQYGFSWANTSTGCFVLGTVQLWGEVVEHERGYRASFAKIKSLDHMINPDPSISLEGLRLKYCS